VTSPEDCRVLVYKEPHKDPKLKLFTEFNVNPDVNHLFVTDSGLVYVTSLDAIHVWSIATAKPSMTLVDDVGVKPGFAFLNDSAVLTIARGRTFISYRPSESGHSPEITTLPSRLSITDNTRVGPAGSYLYVSYPHPPHQRIELFSVDYPITIPQWDVPSIQSVLFETDTLVIITGDNRIVRRKEIPLTEQVDGFCRRKLFDLALRLSSSANLGAKMTAKIHLDQGDDFYAHNKFEEALAEYCQTIGHSEPSYIIQRFVDPPHVRFLLKYLLALQRVGKLSKGHMPLFLNCCAKLRETDILRQTVAGLLEEARRRRPPPFDVRPAVEVLRRNGYAEDAEQIALHFSQADLYLEILHGKRKYGEMLSYMESSLPGEFVERMLLEYGPEMIDNFGDGRDRFIEFAVRCSTDGCRNDRDSRTTVLSPDALDDLFLGDFGMHFRFLYAVLQSGKRELSEVSWTTLIELALRTGSEKVMELLKTPNANYSLDQVLVYLTQFGHAEGRQFVCERIGFWSAMLQDAPPDEILRICSRFGRKDATLWSDGLLKLANSDCDPALLSGFLDEVHRQDALPFLAVLKVLRASKTRRFGVILPFVQAAFRSEQALLRTASQKKRERQAAIAKNEEIVRELTGRRFVIATAECSQCRRELSGDSTHFLCGHSFDDRCLSGGSEFCPICRPEYERLLDEKIARMSDVGRAIEPDDHEVDDYETLLAYAGHSLFVTGVDIMSHKQNEEILAETIDLRKRIQGD
jgi:hypothetical protein